MLLKLHELKMIIKSRKVVRLSRSKKGDFAVLLFLLIICSFMILPMLYAVLQSLKPIEELFLYPPRFFVKKPTFQNFKDAVYLTQSLGVPFSRYLFNSVFVAGVGTVLCTMVFAMAGYSLGKGKFLGKILISNLVVLAMLFRPEVTAIPRYIIIAKMDTLDTYWALLLPQFAATSSVFLIRQFVVSAIPDSTLEAARIDGANEYKIFLSIALPSIKPAIMTSIVFTFNAFWNASGANNFIFSEKLKELPTVLSTIVNGGIARAGAASAVSVVLMIPPIIVFLYSQSSVMETMSHSGLK